MDGKETVYVGIGRLQLQVPEVRSLKGKRSQTRSLIEKIRSRHQILLIESSYQELYQRAGFVICAVSTDHIDLEARFQRVERTIDLNWDGRILSWEIEIHQL